MKLLIENLNSGTTAEDLFCLLGDAKGFISSFVLKDKFGNPSGAGFATFETICDGKEAIQKYNGYQMMGKLIKLSCK